MWAVGLARARVVEHPRHVDLRPAARLGGALDGERLFEIERAAGVVHDRGEVRAAVALEEHRGRELAQAFERALVFDALSDHLELETVAPASLRSRTAPACAGHAHRRRARGASLRARKPRAQLGAWADPSTPPTDGPRSRAAARIDRGGSPIPATRRGHTVAPYFKTLGVGTRPARRDRALSPTGRPARQTKELVCLAPCSGRLRR